MKSSRILIGAVGALLVAGCTSALSEDSETHLTDVGMFYVAGSIAKDAAQHADQALVHYFKSNAGTRTPVIMYPGLGLSSYIYISTPDGRQGWAQQFAKAGHAAYVYDPVDTGPSGFPASAFQGDAPASITSWNANQIWPRWGFGESRDEPYENVRFPIEDMDQFYASWPPRIASGGMGGGAAGGMGGGGAMGMGMGGALQQRGGSSKDVVALIALLEKTGPAVLMPHSMGGTTVFEVANKRPNLIKGVIVIEPVGCPRGAEQIAAWSSDVPFLGVYGDYVDERGQTGRRDACRETAKNVNEAGGSGSMLELTEEGVFGNTHLLMQDNNSADIADRIIAWMDVNVN